MRRSQEVSQYSAESRRRSVRLSQEQPSNEDEISQNSTACVDGHRAAVQEKDTAHVKRFAHGAKRDMKLKYRTVVLEVLSRLPRRDRVSHSGVEDFSWPCRGRARQTRQRRKHTDIFSRAREGEAACERDTGNENHTMVLEVVPRREREPQTEDQLSAKVLHC